MRGRSALCGAALAGLLASGCRPAPAPPGVDLLARYDAAEVLSDRLDLPFLVARAFPERTGWRVARRDAVALVSLRPSPRLVLPVASAGEKELRLRARAREGRSFGVVLSMGGRPLGRLELGPAASETRLRVPASAQSVGDSLLFFAAAGDSGSFELLELTLRPADAETARAPELLEGRLRLPAGSAALFPLARAGGEVSLTARPVGEAGGRLRVALDTDAGSSGVAERDVRREARLQLPLPAAAGYAALRVENLGPGGLWLDTLGLREAGPPQPPVPRRVPSPAPPPQTIVLYLTDTLRPDALGAYGQKASVSPSFDAFARDAVLFETAWAQAPWTRSAVASLFTGLLEGRHGVTGWKGDLDPGLTTLAESLQGAGYRTAGFCANPLVQQERGFAQGFEHWRPPAARMSDAPEARVLVAEALRWLDSHGGPAFVYLHSLEPHTPYRALPRHWREVGGGEPPAPRRLDGIPTQPSPSPDARALVRTAYLAEARQNDEAFGALLDGLRQRGRLDASAVVFLADHGEELWEHGGHGHVRTLYEEMIRIPLAIRLPGGVAGGRRSQRPVSQVDLLPTLLGLAGVEPPADLDGNDLGPELGAAGPGEAVLRADTRVPPQSKRAVRVGSHKLILNDDDERQWRGGARVELFDLGADPGESSNLAGRRRATARYLESLLRAQDARARPGAERERALSPAELEGLRALGYVQ